MNALNHISLFKDKVAGEMLKGAGLLGKMTIYSEI
jgi:hypothetical protein